MEQTRRLVVKGISQITAEDIRSLPRWARQFLQALNTDDIQESDRHVLHRLYECLCLDKDENDHIDAIKHLCSLV